MVERQAKTDFELEFLLTNIKSRHGVAGIQILVLSSRNDIRAASEVNAETTMQRLNRAKQLALNEEI